MLEEKRQKIRLIQQRKVSEKELADFKDLPQEIPLTLSIGHRVYSHICHPEEGVFLGTIAAVDPCEHTYRVVFDRASIGSQTVHDYEIKSVSPVQTIPVRVYIQTYRPKINPTPSSSSSNQQPMIMLTPNKFLTPTPTNLDHLNNPALSTFLSQSNNGPEGEANAGGSLGGFPIRLLLMITRLNKILETKKEFILKLNAMNSEAERLRANNQQLNKEFQMEYAALVLDLDKLNKDLNEYLTGVERYCEQLSPEFKLTDSILSSSSGADQYPHKYLIESCDLVSKLNHPTSKLKSKHILNVIAWLTSILIQVKEFVNSTRAKNRQSSSFLPYCTRALNDSINEIKKNLISAKNIETFEDKVEVHIRHIQSTLCKYNKLHAFNYDIGNCNMSSPKLNNDNSLNDLMARGGKDEIPSSETEDDEDAENELEENQVALCLEEDNQEGDDDDDEDDEDGDGDEEGEDEDDEEEETDDSYNSNKKFSKVNSKNKKKSKDNLRQVIKVKRKSSKRNLMGKQLANFKSNLCSASLSSSNSSAADVAVDFINSTRKKLPIGISI